MVLGLGKEKDGDIQAHAGEGGPRGKVTSQEGKEVPRLLNTQHVTGWLRWQVTRADPAGGDPHADFPWSPRCPGAEIASSALRAAHY